MTAVKIVAWHLQMIATKVLKYTKSKDQVPVLVKSRIDTGNLKNMAHQAERSGEVTDVAIKLSQSSQGQIKISII